MQLSLLDFLGLLLSGIGVPIEGCNYLLWSKRPVSEEEQMQRRTPFRGV